MLTRHPVATLVLASCLVSGRLVDAQDGVGTPFGPFERLTRARANEILNDSSEIAEAVVRQIKSLRAPEEATVVDDVYESLTPALEWRWYSRDHGLLLAIPVKERISVVTSVKAEKVFADVLRRLINQRGWGNPRIQVVFIEPRFLPPMARSIFHVRPCPIVATCECDCQ